MSNVDGFFAVGVNDIHEYCYDSSFHGGTNGFNCKTYCDNDSSCKGYDFHTDQRCILYTTASCPSGLTKYSSGNVGEFIPGGYSSSGWSGCYAKISGMFYIY